MARNASPPAAASSSNSSTSGGGGYAGNALADYTTSEGFTVNESLRRGGTHPMVSALDREFAPLPEAVDVRRVVSGDAARAIREAARTYRPVTDLGYTSTQKTSRGSTGEAIDDFAPGENRRNVVVLEGRLPKGTPAIDVGTPQGGLGYDQGEVLLPRGTKVSVGDRIRSEGGAAVYRVTFRTP